MCNAVPHMKLWIAVGWREGATTCLISRSHLITSPYCVRGTGQASITYPMSYHLSLLRSHIHRRPPMLPLPPQSPTSTSSHSRSPTFRGHRRNSYMPVDRAELVEFRARQRTFDNAYLRTSLSNLTSSVVIFKLFDPRFYKSGSRYSPFFEIK